MKKDTTVNTFTVEEKKEILQFLNDYSAIKEDKNISEKAKLVLSFLLYTGSQQSGKFTIGYEYMSDVLGISKNGISAIVGRLESKGFFTRNKGVKGKNTEYVLNYETMKNYNPISTSSDTINTSKATCINKISTSSKAINTSSNKISTCTNNNATCINYLTDIQALREELRELVQVQRQLIQVLNLYLNININNNINKNINFNNNEFNKIDHEKNILKENKNNFKDDHEKEFSDENLNTISDMKKDNENLNLSENESISSEFEDNEDNEISFFGGNTISESSNSDNSIANENFKISFENRKFKVSSETEVESISSEVEQDENKKQLISESSNSDNSKDNENLQSSTSVEDKNKNTISNTSKDMKTISDENFKIWGKFQPLFEKTMGRMEEYIFTEYESLHNRKDYAGKYNQVKRYITIEANELQTSIPVQGTFGILSRENGKYSFIIADSDVTIAAKNNPNEIVTTGGGGGEGRNTTETQDTSYNAPQAVKMTQVEQLPTEAKKTAPTQSQIANTQSCNDAIYLTTGVSADEWDEISHKHGNNNNAKGAWRDMVVSIHGKEETLSEALNHFKEEKKDGTRFKDTFTYFYWSDPIFANVDKLMKEGKMTNEQMEDFATIFAKVTKGIANYWKKVFASRAPRPNMLSEKRMWEMLGCPKVEDTSYNAPQAVKMTQVEQLPTEAKKTAPTQSQIANTQCLVTLPNLNDLYQLSYSDAVAELQKFVKDNPNLQRKQKEQFNFNICSAFGIDGLYEL